MIDFSGRWCGEFRPQTTRWSAGLRVRENRTGRSGHEHFPGLVVPLRGATNTSGTACAFHYGWPGGHAMVAEELPDGRRQVQFGHAPGSEAASPARRFATAPLFATWSMAGTNGCAVAFQRHLRARIVELSGSARPRPVHYNCWEAVYFDHDFATLKDIAVSPPILAPSASSSTMAGSADATTTHRRLGDWQVDTRKYPDGLTPLIDHVQGLGMTFGLWVEPEMINPNSDTFRAHPDWVLGPPDQPLGRNQLALDMANPAVRDALHAEPRRPAARPCHRLPEMGPQQGAARPGCGPDPRHLRSARPPASRFPAHRDRKLRLRRRPDRFRHPRHAPTASGSPTATTRSNACASSTRPPCSCPPPSPAAMSARAAAIPPAASSTCACAPGSPPSAISASKWTRAS